MNKSHLYFFLLFSHCCMFNPMLLQGMEQTPTEQILNYFNASFEYLQNITSNPKNPEKTQEQIKQEFEKKVKQLYPTFHVFDTSKIDATTENLTYYTNQFKQNIENIKSQINTNISDLKFTFSYFNDATNNLYAIIHIIQANTDNRKSKREQNAEKIISQLHVLKNAINKKITQQENNTENNKKTKNNITKYLDQFVNVIEEIQQTSCDTQDNSILKNSRLPDVQQEI